MFSFLELNLLELLRTWEITQTNLHTILFHLFGIDCCRNKFDPAIWYHYIRVLARGQIPWVAGPWLSKNTFCCYKSKVEYMHSHGQIVNIPCNCLLQHDGLKHFYAKITLFLRQSGRFINVIFSNQTPFFFIVVNTWMVQRKCLLLHIAILSVDKLTVISILLTF